MRNVIFPSILAFLLWEYPPPHCNPVFIVKSMKVLRKKGGGREGGGREGEGREEEGRGKGGRRKGGGREGGGREGEGRERGREGTQNIIIPV